MNLMHECILNGTHDGSIINNLGSCVGKLILNIWEYNYKQN